MLFSFIVPIFNVEKYLERCLLSIKNQTFKDFEVVLIDDGSTDSCPQICDSYALSDSRFRVIHQENQGLSVARNVGIKVAKGDYLFFVDADDYIELHSLELLLPIIKDGNRIISFNLIGEKQIHETRSYDALEYLKEPSIRIASWAYVYQRAFLVQNNLWFLPGILYEDTLFTPQAIDKSGSVYVTNLSLYHYEVGRKGSISRTRSEKHISDFLEIVKRLDNLYSDEHFENVRKVRMQSALMFYFSLYFQQKGYAYGRKYVRAIKPYIKDNIYRIKEKILASLFCLSPVLYWIALAFYRCVRKAFKTLRLI